MGILENNIKCSRYPELIELANALCIYCMTGGIFFSLTSKPSLHGEYLELSVLLFDETTYPE